LSYGSVAAVIVDNSLLYAVLSKLVDNEGSGILAMDSIVGIEDCYILRNKRDQITAYGNSGLMLSYCDVRGVTEDSRCLDADENVYIQTKSCTGSSSFIETVVVHYSKKGRPNKRVYDDFFESNDIATSVIKDETDLTPMISEYQMWNSSVSENNDAREQELQTDSNMDCVDEL
jgi:hypothetical protein